ncbi:hypothetical protein F2P81_004002 [Scophthalmus maximus]|uniref:Uncharacterized protein n=1 Tax=Scophthalmus maximus TaxID=52904 RepID=A0A6A4TNL6_SCOMX|nr:hypothetical protein F2P81_004002 [Scophthalmus maximus]
MQSLRLFCCTENRLIRSPSHYKKKPTSKREPAALTPLIAAAAKVEDSVQEEDCKKSFAIVVKRLKTLEYPE